MQQRLTKGRRPVQEVQQVSRVALPHQFQDHPWVHDSGQNKKIQKASAVSFAPPLHDRSSLLFYELVQLLFACSIYFQRPVLDIQCDMMSHPPAPPNHTFPSLVEGARLSVAYKEIIGKIRELITKEHASSGTWNLKELLLNHKAKLPRNKQIKFHEILIDSAY